MLHRIVLLHAVQEHHRLLRLAERVVDRANRLQILDVVLQLAAHRVGNLLHLRQCLLVASSTVQD